MYDPMNPYGNLYGQYGYNYPLQNQVPQRPIQPTNTQNTIIRVHGREGALTLGNSLGANKAVLAIDETQTNLLWCIATDGAGFATVKPFNYFEAEEKKESHDQNEDFVSRKEFSELSKKVDDFIKEFKE